MAQGPDWTAAGLALTFLITGVATTLCNQWIYNEGAGGSGMAMVTVLPTYLGMLLVVLLPGTELPTEPSQLLPVSAVDFLGAWTGAVGLFLAGSAIYQVLYSSIVVFTALLASVVLHKPLSGGQWASVLLVALGLSLSAASSANLPSATSLAAGVVFTMCSTVIYAATYVWHERILHGGPNGAGAVPERVLCAATGLYGSFFCVVYLVAYTIPQWEALIAGPVREKGGSWTVIIVQLLMLLASSLFHNLAYFSLIDRLGGLATGVLQGLRAVMVFFGSALFFCDTRHEAQCFTLGKAIASFVVIAGVVSFSYASSRQRKATPARQEPPV